MTLTIISAYLVGSVLFYLWARWSEKDNWTVKDRTMAILFALLSWASIFIFASWFVAKAINDGLKNNSKAKW